MISYRVVTQNPFAVEECTVGTGAACGSLYLDQAFENLLRGRFAKKRGAEAKKILKPKLVAELVQRFNSSIKFKFNPLHPSAETEFDIHIGNYDIPRLGLKDGYLHLNKFNP